MSRRAFDPGGPTLPRVARSGSSAALEQACGLALPALRAHARCLVKNEVLVDDLVQDTLLGAIESRGRFRAGAAVLPWLAGILRNHVRRLADVRRFEPVSDDQIDPRALPDDVAACTELLGLSLAALEALPAIYREPLRMRVDLGLTPGEIASATNLSPSTVRTRLARGRTLLRGIVRRTARRCDRGPTDRDVRLVSTASEHRGSGFRSSCDASKEVDAG